MTVFERLSGSNNLEKIGFFSLRSESKTRGHGADYGERSSAWPKGENVGRDVRRALKVFEWKTSHALSLMTRRTPAKQCFLSAGAAAREFSPRWVRTRFFPAPRYLFSRIHYSSLLFFFPSIFFASNLFPFIRRRRRARRRMTKKQKNPRKVFDVSRLFHTRGGPTNRGRGGNSTWRWHASRSRCRTRRRKINDLSSNRINRTRT